MRDQTLQARARQLRLACTDAERCLWRYLRKKNLRACRFRRQYALHGYIVDFVCLEHMLIIEVDGGQHQSARSYDERRDTVLKGCGFQVLRFWNHDVLCRTEAVLEVIHRALDLPPP